MCYSKEVSLLSGSGMATVSSLLWWKYVYHLAQNKVVEIKAKNKELKSFFLYLVLAYFSIAGHQFGEFFSLALQNEFVYKLGLISSVSCTFFLIKALEKLTKKSFLSWVVALIILLLSIFIFMTPMEFSNMRFWLRGYDHLQWSVTWITLFIYFWTCSLYIVTKTASSINRRMLFYMLGGVSTSFAISILYAILATYFTKNGIPANCSVGFVSDFTLRNDFPSIWCTSSVLQAPVYWLMINTFLKKYDTKKPIQIGSMTWKTYLSLICITAMILLFLVITYPFIFSVGWRFIAQ